MQKIQKNANNNIYREKFKGGKLMSSQIFKMVICDINNKYDKE